MSDVAVEYSAGTVVVKAVAGEKERRRQEHELDMTEHVVGAAAAADQVLETMSNVDMPEGSSASKVGLEYMQDEWEQGVVAAAANAS